MTVQGEHFTILGGGGFVGSHFVRRMEAQGIAVSAPPRDDQSIFRKPLGHVIYSIGLTADYLARPFDTVEAHVSFFSRVLRDAEFDSIVYLSSTRLYDFDDRSGKESDDIVLNPANTRHLYDFSKGLGETLCNVCGDGRARVARLACVYSDDLSADNFLHRMVTDALSRKHLALVTHLEATRDYVHIDDVCDALVNIASRGSRHIYNVASGTNITNRELIDIIGRHTGCHITATAPSTADSVGAPVIDIAALRDDFGLEPRKIATALPALIAANRPLEERRAAS